MATNTITVTWCDIHLQRGEEVFGESRGLPYVDQPVDLCDSCLKELTASVRTLILNTLSGERESLPTLVVSSDRPAPRVRKGVRPANGKRPWVCPLCTEDYGSTTGLKNHFAVAHSISVSSIEDIFGDVCPLDGEHMGTGRQAASMHARKEHRAANVSQLFVRAARKGDRHGVVQRRVGLLSLDLGVMK